MNIEISQWRLLLLKKDKTIGSLSQKAIFSLFNLLQQSAKYNINHWKTCHTGNQKVRRLDFLVELAIKSIKVLKNGTIWIKCF